MTHFDRRLSRQLDGLHQELDNLRGGGLWRWLRRRWLRWQLARTERKAGLP